MEDKVYSLSKYRLEKAKQDLLTSKFNFENQLFPQSINRPYYAIFHAARALLAFDRFDSKKHSGIISYFISNYIKNKKIDTKFSNIITTAERIRLNSDYKDFYVISKEDTKKQIENAEEFIKMMESFIAENYSK